MNKQYLVLGIKDVPIKDPQSEADNPYIFCNLLRALEFARDMANDKEQESYSRVVEIIEVMTFDYTQNSPKNMNAMQKESLDCVCEFCSRRA